LATERLEAAGLRPRLHHGKGGLPTRLYLLGTTPSELHEWIDDTHRKYRQRNPRTASGTLASDVKEYGR
jgi:hypothetical protein